MTSLSLVNAKAGRRGLRFLLIFGRSYGEKLDVKIRMLTKKCLAQFIISYTHSAPYNSCLQQEAGTFLCANLGTFIYLFVSLYYIIRHTGMRHVFSVLKSFKLYTPY